MILGFGCLSYCSGVRRHLIAAISAYINSYHVKGRSINLGVAKQ
jgi:hypothetical protein